MARGEQHVTVEEIADLLPPGHPAGHGRIGLRVRWDAPPAAGRDRRIVAAQAIVGSVHRGAEKLAEVRDYRQAIMLLDRHDWWGAFGSEVGFVLAVERMAGLSVPRRATLLRIVLAELTRCSSHLAMLAGALDTTVGRRSAGLAAVAPAAGGAERSSGTDGGDDGAASRAAAAAARDVIEAVRDLFVHATGNRVHPMFCRIGGIAADVEDGWPAAVTAVLPRLVDVAARAGEALDGVGRGLAVLSAADVRAMAVTGPVARAAGVDVDLRRDEPYLAYAEVFEASDVVPSRDVRGGGDAADPTGPPGDAATRWQVMAAEVAVSCRIVQRGLDLLAPGPVRARLPRTLRVPQGAVYVATESPQGSSGYYLVSAAGPAPHRLKIRASMFDTAAALGSALPGTSSADLPLALASLPVIAGDIDR